MFFMIKWKHVSQPLALKTEWQKITQECRMRVSDAFGPSLRDTQFCFPGRKKGPSGQMAQ